SLSLTALGASPALSCLTELGLAVGGTQGGVPIEVLRSLAQSTYLRLKRLHLGNARFAHGTSPGVSLREPFFQQLEELSLRDFASPTPPLPDLLHHDGFPTLKRLRLFSWSYDHATETALLDRFGQEVVTFDAPHEITYVPGRRRWDWFPRRRGHFWPNP